MTPTARRLIAWLVLFAMAWSSAAPAFASRVSVADLAALGICSLAAQDARAAAPGEQRQDSEGGLGSHLHHCPFCAPSAHAALPTAPASFSMAPAQPASGVLPCLAEPAPPVYPGSTCRPRGPPRTA
jgi:hypothetical protein